MVAPGLPVRVTAPRIACPRAKMDVLDHNPISIHEPRCVWISVSKSDLPAIRTRRTLPFFKCLLESTAMVGSNWDQALLLKLNTIAGGHAYIYDFADNALFRGFPIFFSLVALWFADDDGKRRSRILAGLAGVCIATVLSVWCQFHVQVHTRPLIDAALHLKTVELR